MMKCFGHKTECKAPCEEAAACIEETGRAFNIQLAKSPSLKDPITATS